MSSSNNHIFKLLQAFSKDELKKFKTFLDSPYFNSNKKVKILFNEIVKYYPSFQHENLSKEHLYRIIYGKDDAEKSNLRYLFSELLYLALEFIKTENFKNEEETSNIYLLQGLNKKNQSNLFKLSIKKIEDEINSGFEIDGNNFHFRYLVEVEKYNHLKTNEKVIKNCTSALHSSLLINSDKYLCIYFIMETVCEYVNLKIHALKYNLDVSGAFTVELMKNICLNNIKQAIGRDFKYLFILDLYIALYETFENSDNNEYYRNYKNLIKKYDKQLSRDEKGFHFSKLINYLILKDLKHSGSKEYALELFEVYKIFLEKKLYQNKKIDYLPESLYRAILFLGIRLRELEWVITFIDKYTPLVQSKNKDNLQIFGYAFYYFSKSDFEKSLELTNKINFDYFIFKFDVKALIIKIYFELGYFENALSILHSFKELLRTDNFLNRDTKEYYYNFMKIMKELIMLKIQNKTEADYTAIKLKSMENVLNKDWLLKKFNEIKKSAMKVNAG